MPSIANNLIVRWLALQVESCPTGCQMMKGCRDSCQLNRAKPLTQDSKLAAPQMLPAKLASTPLSQL